MSQGTGLRDWLIQRFTAVFLGAYFLFLIYFVFCHSPLYYDAWRGLFSNYLMQIATVTAIAAVGWHAWIGLRTVLTDYVKCSALRQLLQGVILLALAGYGVWGIMILWGQ